MNVRKGIERHYQEKVKLEDEIMSKMQEQLTVDKASDFMKKTITKSRKKATLAVRTTISVSSMFDNIRRHLQSFLFVFTNL